MPPFFILTARLPSRVPPDRNSVRRKPVAQPALCRLATMPVVTLVDLRCPVGTGPAPVGRRFPRPLQMKPD